MKLRLTYAFSLFTLLYSFSLAAAPAEAPEYQGIMDSVVVQVTPIDTITICRGDTLQLGQTNNVLDSGLVWRPAEGFISSVNDPAPRVVPVVSRYYVVTVSSSRGTASDSVFVNVNQLVLPELLPDTTVCQNTALALVASPVEDTRGTTYQWEPNELLEDDTNVNAVFPASSGGMFNFVLTATSEDGICSAMDTVNVTVISSSLTIAGGDTLFLCDSAPLDTLNVNAGGTLTGEITWSPATGIMGLTTGNSIVIQPAGDITYFATAEVNGCTQIDSIAVRVDSLPDDLSLMNEPVKDPYCIGDTFYLVGNLFDVADYPLIEHEWIERIGMQSPMDLYQGIFTAMDTFLFERRTVNGACIDTARFQINVTQPPTLIFDPPNPLICPGEPLQVNVTFDPMGPSGSLEWMDPNGTLSCTDCLDPIVTTNSSVTYEIEVTADSSDCTSSESYTVNVITDESLPVLTPIRTICLGESIQLITGGVNDDFTYMISGGAMMSNDPFMEFSPTETTEYTITTTTECGSDSRTLTIQVIDGLDVSFTTPAEVCAGDVISLEATVSPDVPGLFSFSTPAGPILQEDTDEFQVNDDTEFTVIFSDNFGCATESATSTTTVDNTSFTPVIVATRPDGTPLAVDTITQQLQVLEGAQILLTIVNVPAGFTGDIEWDGNASPGMATGQTITITIPENSSGSLIDYLATATTGAGCTQIGGISIIVVENPFSIPEIISANNDGTNDNFRVFFQPSATVDAFTLSVFNRWGQEVFSSSDPDEGWDGSKNGKPQNLGTYLFLTRFQINGVDFEEEGQFSLVR